MTTDELRAKFEAFFSDCNLRRLNMRSDCYEDARIALLWEGWQAAYDSRDAEVEALRKDAERYRWLRSKCTDELCVRRGVALITGAALNDSIDAEMRKENK